MPALTADRAIYQIIHIVMSFGVKKGCFKKSDIQGQHPYPRRDLPNARPLQLED